MLNRKALVGAMGASLLCFPFSTSLVTQPRPDSSRSITVADGPNIATAPYLVAIGSGAFERRGIQLKSQTFGSGNAAFAALIGGSADFCTCGPSHLLSAAAAGRDVSAVFNFVLGNTFVIIANKKFESDRGQDIKKYDRSTWGYTAEGSTSHLMLIKLAQAAGLDWKNQKGIAVGGVEAFVPTLRQERIDIAATETKSAAAAIKLGIAYLAFNSADPRISEPIFGQNVGLLMVASRSLPQRDPKLMQDFVDALREGLLLVQKHRDDPAKLLSLMPAEIREANKADFETQWALLKEAYALDGTFTSRQVDDTVKYAVEVGVVKSPMNLETARKYFDNSWAVQAVKNVPSLP